MLIVLDTRDESDRKFFDVAKCLHAKLVTGNFKHYPVHSRVYFLILHLVSCTINRTFVNRGKVGHNVPQTRINTTFLTTKG